MSDFERRLLAFSPAMVYVCQFGGDYRTTYLSDNVRDILGYTPEDFLDDAGFWFDRIHPDDLSLVLAGLEVLGTQNHYVHEYRFRACNGEYRWMRDEFCRVRDEATGIEEMIGSWLDITDRKTMEEHYRRFTELTSDYVHFCTRKGTAPFRIKWIAGAINPISGYTIQDVLDLGCWLPLVHPDDRKAVTDYLFALTPGDCKEIEFRIVTHGGEVRWVQEKGRCEAGPVAGELVLYGAVTDITERKRAEEILRDSEGFLREAAQVARLGRWRWNFRTNEAEWSTMTLEIFGLTDKSCRTFSYDELIERVHPDDRSLVAANLHEARDFDHAHRIVLPDGSLRYVQAKGQVHYDAAGKPATMVGTILDVTDQKQIEMRLLESDRIKSDFIATASHELRTPLAVIQGYAELMLDDVSLDTGQRREFLEVIYDKSQSLEKIVDDLLDVSRVESGRIICLEFGQSNIVEEIRKVVEHFRREAPRHRFSLRLPEEELCLSVDQGKIVQVLENLLGNAVKFSTPESEISVRAEWSDDSLQVVIADSGVGIAPEYQEHIFDKFYRVDATDTAVPGLGIGLYLVKKIIEAHRGRIWVESAPGRGTTFSFTLPR